MKQGGLNLQAERRKRDNHLQSERPLADFNLKYIAKVKVISNKRFLYVLPSFGFAFRDIRFNLRYD